MDIKTRVPNILIMELRRKRHNIAAGIGLLILIGFAITNVVGQITTQETGPSAINITTDNPVVRETEADFQATLTGFDDTDYDAVLIYWNYSEDSSLNQWGPATITNVEEQVSVLHPTLNPNTGYNVEAYAEPLVWDDPTLNQNLQNKLEKVSRVSNNADLPFNLTDSNKFNYSYPYGSSITGVSDNQGQDDTTAYVEYEVGVPGNLDYNISVSSESCCDEASMRINGGQIFGIAGDQTETGSTSVARGDIIRVQYDKDGSVSELDDEVVINEFTLS